MTSAKEWNPALYSPELLRKNLQDYDHKSYGMIILNQPLEHVSYVINAEERSDCVVCADGGANRLFDLHRRAIAQGFRHEDDLNMPRAVIGDLDSINPEVRRYYAEAGVIVVQDTNQYATDLRKCLHYVKRTMTPSQTSFDIVIFGSLSGRADQAFSQIHHLYLANSDPELKPPGTVFLITPESILFLLEPGLNVISTPVRKGMFTENVGIIPIGKPAIITTRGLEWDVTYWLTDFGSQVSTSNHIKQERVEVETSGNIIFTMEFAR